jgi:signal transduction histidine kinase/TolB-like protein
MSGAHLISNLRNSFRNWSGNPLDHGVADTVRGAQPRDGAGPAGSTVSQPPSEPASAYRDQKMEAVGQLTAGIAHDFNNLLTIIVGNAGALRLAAERWGNPADVRRAAAIEGAAQRGGRLATQLLAFSRKQMLSPEVLSAFTVLSELLDLLTRAAGDAVQMKLAADEDLWSCRVDRGQLESAVLNLIFNARDAMPEGGCIRITCGNHRAEAESARKYGGTAGDYVRIEVADTGTGIPADIMARVFEPFFTTKPIGQGSGLGLAQVHGFAGQSGGWVELTSEVGHGSCVAMMLPRDGTDSARSSPPEPDRVVSTISSHTILLVEPDTHRRADIAVKLRLSGYKVLEAGDEAGAERWRDVHEPLHLLITRVALPNRRSGVELAHMFQKRRHGLAVLLIADTLAGAPVASILNRGHCEILRTPCGAADVIGMTQVMLRGESFSMEREQLHAELREGSGAIDHDKANAGVRRGVQPGHEPARTHAPSPATNPKSVRMGVLPMRTLSPGYDEGFAFGLAEELTTAFSRFRWISCTSPVSIAALAGEPISDSPRWRELDLDYLLEGSVRQNGNDIRIVIRLVNMRQSGVVAWTKRFDANLTDVLKLQDEIAADIAAEVGPEVLIWEGETAASRPQVDPTSYSMMLRAIPAIYRLDQDGFRSAGPLLKRALELDPSNAAAHSWLAHWYMLLVGQGWANDMRRAAEKADALARQAIILDPGDARGLTVAGHIQAFLHKKPDHGLRLHDRAVGLNANLALAWCYSGLALSYMGRHAEAIERISRAQRLSPHDPHGFFFDMAMVMPLLLSGDLVAAAEIGHRARRANPGLSSTYKGLISTLGLLGRPDEVGSLRKELAVLEPNFSVQEAIRRSPLTQPKDLQRYADGLRLAGCPEHAPRSLLSQCWAPVSDRWKRGRTAHVDAD